MLVVIITLTVSLVKVSKEIPEYKLEDVGGSPNSPYSLQVYTSIEKYSKRYKVPKYIAHPLAGS